MALTTAEFEKFAAFGRARLRNGDPNMTLNDLIVEWESQRNRAAINAAIREGIEDAEVGRYRPAADVMRDLERKHALEVKCIVALSYNFEPTASGLY